MTEEIIKEVSFSSLNYTITVKSNDKNDKLENLKQIGLEILNIIKEKEC